MRVMGMWYPRVRAGAAIFIMLSLAAFETQAEPQNAVTEELRRRDPVQFDWQKRANIDMDGRADQKRDEAIEKLKKLLPTIGQGEARADVLFRLGEMYWTKSKYLSMKAMRDWDKALQVYEQSGRKGKAPTLESFAEHPQAEAYRTQALELYQQIIDNFPNYNRRDEVLYDLASSLYESGEKNRGIELFWSLIKNRGDSDFAADTWLQLGEHFFNANKLPQAIKAYGEAAKTAKPRIYSYAMYKLAWCDYNQKNYASALEKFRKVVNYAKKQDAGVDLQKGDISERDKIQLVDEALADMVRTFQHLDAIEDPFDYYTNEVGRVGAYRYLRNLGQLYDEDGKYVLAIKVYQEINERYPYDVYAPQNQAAIMKAYASLGKSDMVRKEARRLIDLYSPEGVWAKQNAKDEKALQGAFDLTEGELAKLVTEQHRAAQQTKLTETYYLARDLYRDYLEKFRQGANSYKFSFYYAEILFDLKEFTSAAEAYSNVVDRDVRGEFAGVAAYTAILAWEKVVSGHHEKVGAKIDEQKSGKAKGALDKLENSSNNKSGELSETERKLVNACDRFVQVSPKDEDVLKVKYKAARLYYNKGLYVEANSRFVDILETAPKDPLAKTAALSMLAGFSETKNWPELAKQAERLRGNKTLMAERMFAQQVQEYLEGAAFLQIREIVEPKEKADVTAEHYEQFAKTYPQSSYAKVALYNAMVLSEKATQTERARTLGKRLLQNYREAKDGDEKARKTENIPATRDIVQKTLWYLATASESLVDFPAAAAYYEDYLNSFKSSEARPDALFNAALYREALGDYDAAFRHLTAYVKEYGDRPDVWNVAWRAGLVLQKKGDLTGAIRYFQNLEQTKLARSRVNAVCLQGYMGRLLKDQQKTKEAQKQYELVQRIYEQLNNQERKEGCALEAVAAATFFNIEQQFDDYREISLRVDEKQMAKNLLRKLEKADELQKRYLELLQLGHGDYGIAALVRMGQVYQHLSSAIFETPCPRRLNDDQCGIYQAGLQEKALPLEEKAIDAFEKAVSKAYELGLYNNWLQGALAALKKYAPNRYPDARLFDVTSYVGLSVVEPAMSERAP